MKHCETHKLFYKKYSCKLVVYNSLAHIFRTELQRDGVLSYTRQELDRCQLDYENGISLQRQIYRTFANISNEDFFDAKDIYSALKICTDDYMVRMGIGNDIILYSNNDKMLSKLADKLRTRSIELWKPNKDILNCLQRNKDIVIVNNQPFLKLRIYLGRKPGSSELAKWLKNNTDKSKVGKICLEALEDNSFVNGLYFYVRDEKVLNLISLLVGDNIVRIEKLIWREEIDKY